jgi:hypothetical protein
MLLGLAACLPQAPRQVNYGEARPSLWGRDVEVETRPAYFALAPACALVQPAGRRFASGETGRLVEDALAAHFAGRFRRVVPAAQVTAAARRLALDPARPAHRRHLARHFACPGVLDARPHGADGVYAGVWTQRRVGLQVTLLDARDGSLLWRARHVATHSEGGLPVSPLGAVAELVMTTGFHADPEVPVSLLHDATRRIAATLPALPHPPGAAPARPARPERAVSRERPGSATIPRVAHPRAPDGE